MTDVWFFAWAYITNLLLTGTFQRIWESLAYVFRNALCHSRENSDIDLMLLMSCIVLLNQEIDCVSQSICQLNRHVSENISKIDHQFLTLVTRGHAMVFLTAGWAVQKSLGGNHLHFVFSERVFPTQAFIRMLDPTKNPVFSVIPARVCIFCLSSWLVTNIYCKENMYSWLSNFFCAAAPWNWFQ